MHPAALGFRHQLALRQACGQRPGGRDHDVAHAIWQALETLGLVVWKPNPQARWVPTAAGRRVAERLAEAAAQCQRAGRCAFADAGRPACDDRCAVDLDPR